MCPRKLRQPWSLERRQKEKKTKLPIASLQGNNNSDVQAVLGASLGRSMPTNSYWRVYLPSDTKAYYQDVKLLRDFAKKASGYRWHHKSKKSRDEGFSTASLLNLPQDDIVVGAGSLLLQMKVDKEDLQEELVSLLAKSDLSKKINFKKPSAKKNKTALEVLGLSKGKKVIVEVAMMVLGGETVDKSMYLEMYKMALAPRMKALNNRAVKEKNLC